MKTFYLLFFCISAILPINAFSQINWTVYTTENSGIFSNTISDIAAGRDNHIWFSSSTLGVCRYDQEESWEIFNQENGGTPYNDVWHIAVDSSNNAWIASGYLVFKTIGLAMINDTGFVSFSSPAPSQINDIVTVDNQIYIGNFSGGYFHYNGTEFSHYNCDLLANGSNVRVLSFDQSGNLWMGIYETLDIYTITKGVAMHTGSSWEFYDIGSLIPGGYIRDIEVDQTNVVWVATSIGVIKKEDTSWELLTTSNSGLPSNNVSCVKISSNNTRWFATDKGLVKFDGIEWVVYDTLNSELPNNNVNQIEFDYMGNLWGGTANGIFKIFFPLNKPELTDVSINVLPNPASERIELKGKNILSVELFDGFGRSNYYRSFQTPMENIIIDLNDIEEGLYMVKIKTTGGAVVKKVIVL
ncbi:MAG: hypothetical protein A2W91_07035 [Bacteroidetes bacterium GWF2_38_335]|nr:MAG: hypothetical protein A2W91_07035 [Bacteroidetes bacterium GWF2_38_335]OFY77082.1 MAG: hypothetical protein A2281_14270 [Bacteroidetes bacterium RIFOXYA12_FULL_38_20]HBS84972.1 hypothetical protein [Bacteroidales bacterium]